MRSSEAILASAFVFAAVAAGCRGAPCRDAASARALVDARRDPVLPTREPHAVLAISHQRLDRLLADALPALEPVTIPVPPPLAALGVPELELAASRITIEPAAPGKVAAAVDLVASLGGVSLPLGAVTVEGTPAIESRGGRDVLRVSFAGDAVRRVALGSGPTAAQRLIWARAYNALPAALRDHLGRLEFLAAVELAARHLGDAGFDLVRQHLLSRIDEVARIEITLPDLPIARTEIDSGQNALAIRLWTDLPVAAGLAPRPRPATPRAAELRLSVAAVAEIANWSIETGRAPRRHDRELRPDPNGDYTPIFGWRDDPRRPLVIWVFRSARPCGVIRVVARPTVETRADAGEIAVGVTDGVVERVEGSAAIKLGVWASRVFRGAIDKSRAFASTTTTRVGRLTLATTIRRARLDGDDAVVEIDLVARPDGA